MRLNTESVRRYTAGLLVGLAVAAPAAAKTRANAAGGAAVAASNIRIDNFGQVDSRYFRGAQPDGSDYASLAALGVKAIINLTSDDAKTDEGTMVKRAGMKYFQIPMTTHVAPTTAQVAEFLSIVTNPLNQPVYVHCVGGRHRTGVMTAVYRMTQNHWSAAQAFSEMKRYKFGADFLHSEFKDFVFGYPVALARNAAAHAAEVAKPKSGG